MKTAGQKYWAKIKRVRKKADDLWQVVVKELNPKCEVCGQPTIVGHHFVFKAESNYLRYAIKNGVGLCFRCHRLIHQNSASEYGVIIERKRGEDWFNDLMLDKQKTTSTTLAWYEEKLEALEKLKCQ